MTLLILCRINLLIILYDLYDLYALVELLGYCYCTVIYVLCYTLLYNMCISISIHYSCTTMGAYIYIYIYIYDTYAHQ